MTRLIARTDIRTDIRTAVRTARDRSTHVVNLNANRHTRCHLCGFAEVRTDEVLDPEVLFLAECPRCESRWTSREPIVAPLPMVAAPLQLVAKRFQRVPARVASPIAPAA